MNAIFIEIFDVFRKEKIYLFLLIAIVFIYALVFFVHRAIPEREKPPQKAEAADTLFHEASRKTQEIEHYLTKRRDLRVLVNVFVFSFCGATVLGLLFGSIDLWSWFRRRASGPVSPPQNRMGLSEGEELRIRWGIGEVLKLVILFFSLGLGLNLVMALFKFSFARQVGASMLIMFHTLLLDLAAVSLIFFLIQRSGSGLKDLFGFRFSIGTNGAARFFGEMWAGIRTYFVILPFFLGILFALVYLTTLIQYEPPPHPLVKILLREEPLSAWMVLCALLVACVVGPVVEEIFFRGFFYPALRKYIGMGWTMIVTAALFAGVHENIFSFLPIFFLGLVLCYLYERRRNLVSCISLHVLHNAAFIAYFFLMKNILVGAGV